jgi:predicted AAA+ superfamily ATPase
MFLLDLNPKLLYIWDVIQRLQIDYALARMFKNKAFLVFGPRQTGKTTFVEKLL